MDGQRLHRLYMIIHQDLILTTLQQYNFTSMTVTTYLLLSNLYPFTVEKCYDAFERDVAVFTYFHPAGYYRALVDQLHYHGITTFN